MIRHRGYNNNDRQRFADSINNININNDLTAKVVSNNDDNNHHRIRGAMLMA